MNTLVILTLFISVPSSILGAPALDKSLNQNLPSSSSAETKSSQRDGPSVKALVKRDVQPEPSDVLYPYYGMSSEMMPKRAVAGLNKALYTYVFERPGEVRLKDVADDSSGDVTRTMVKGPGFDRFPAALIERRGQPQKDRKIYLRCYFNAVSCFKRRK